MRTENENEMEIKSKNEQTCDHEEMEKLKKNKKHMATQKTEHLFL